MKDLARKELISNMESLMGQYCEGCFLNQYLRKESGRRMAHRFCITQCTVGEKLKEFGKKLS